MLIGLLVFLSITLALFGLYYWLAPTRSEMRLKHMSAPQAGAGWKASFVKAATPLSRLSLPEGDWQNSPLRLKFLHAGIRDGDVRILYFAAKTVLPLAFAALVYVALLVRGTPTSGLHSLLYVVAAALVGCYLPNALLHVLARRRQREVFENFPDAADLMLVCVEAGLSMDAAMVKVAEEMRMKSAPVAEELQLVNLELRAGSTREQALRNLALRTGVEEVGTFALMLTQADKFGTSIGDSLRVFSEELRHKRQARAEEKAAKIPTKMLFPLVTCIFPAIIMVILGPAVIQIVRTVLPAIAGHH